MKRILKVFLFFLCFIFLGCQSIDEVQNIDILGSVSQSFESKVTIVGAESPMGDKEASFKEDIKVSDITLHDALKGKYVKNVKYINESKIEVVIDGKCENLTDDTNYGKIVISHKALLNDTDAFDYVIVEKDNIYVTSCSSFSSSKTYISTFALSNGNFNLITINEVQLAPGFSGNVESVELTNNKLTIKVTNANNCPTLIIDKSATSFNEEITISMSSLSKYNFN